MGCCLEGVVGVRGSMEGLGGECDWGVWYETPKEWIQNYVFKKEDILNKY